MIFAPPPPAPTLEGDSLAAFEALDLLLRRWSYVQGGMEHRYPSLIPAETLERAEYPSAFPHLLMAAAVAADPAAGLPSGRARLAGAYLSPAVCYHAYASLASTCLEGGRIFSARGTCFRAEEPAELLPGRRHVEFQMRELIFVGAAEWVREQITPLPREVSALAQECGLPEVAWQPASDPFFLPRAAGKARLQQLLGTKDELCLPDGLAIASINRHGTFFGERFDIRLPDGGPAHTACLAFGLDRWFAHQEEAQ